MTCQDFKIPEISCKETNLYPVRGVLFVTEDAILGKLDISNWIILPWYKRLYGFFNKSYKNKYLKVIPFKCKLI